MNSSEWKRLFRQYLLADLPGFRYRGDVLYSSPPDYLLQGILFETSSFLRTRFNVMVFVQPLYLPVTHLMFIWGGRLGQLGGGNERWWEMTPENEAQVMGEVRERIRAEALPFFAQLATIQDLASTGRKLHGDSDDPWVGEAVGYAHFLAGDARRSVSELSRLHRDILALPHRYPWQDEQAARIARGRDLIEADPARAQVLLDEWTVQTRAALRLATNGLSGQCE